MPFIPDSILHTTKKALGIDADYDAFDHEIIMHINSAFATMTQLGIGPKDGFMIEDANALWTDFIGNRPVANSVKSLMYLKVRLIWDPPATSFVLTSIENQIRELEWRLNVSEDTTWEPYPVTGNGEESVIWTLEGDNIWPPEAKTGELGYYPGSGNIWRKS